MFFLWDKTQKERDCDRSQNTVHRFHNRMIYRFINSNNNDRQKLKSEILLQDFILSQILQSTTHQMRKSQQRNHRKADKKGSPVRYTRARNSG